MPLRREKACDAFLRLCKRFILDVLCRSLIGELAAVDIHSHYIDVEWDHRVEIVPSRPKR